ncbi:GntR family transcriptional regulator [Leifsonia poae]|uniref:GntR family transcriptional regulator n=1 Tax=Leifsonia poae TaxID=110933 RepID=UPI001CBD65E4|nr:GntR family transcriptional regulator [Leifsonia poae]
MSDELAARIRSMLETEGWMPGERLGSERELAVTLGVTRSRLRVALDILRGERVVRALIGRAGGIYVADARLERNLDGSPSLPEIARVQGVQLATRVLDLDLVPATPRDRRVLLLQSDERVYRLRRVREAGGTPLSIEENRLPEFRFPRLAQHDVTQLGRVAREAYGFTTGRVAEVLEVIQAAPAIAALLGLDAGSAIVRIRRVSYNSAEEPTELAFEYFDGSRMRFHLRPYGFEGNVHRTPPR